MSWMEQAPSSAEVHAAIGPASSEAVFLVLRRMRVPFIVLITIFSVSILGLTLIPAHRTRERGGWASSTPSTS